MKKDDERRQILEEAAELIYIWSEGRRRRSRSTILESGLSNHPWAKTTWGTMSMCTPHTGSRSGRHHLRHWLKGIRRWFLMFILRQSEKGLFPWWKSPETRIRPGIREGCRALGIVEGKEASLYALLGERTGYGNTHPLSRVHALSLSRALTLVEFVLWAVYLCV